MLFLNTKVVILFLPNLSVVGVKKRQFYRQFFDENILKS
jgi:hypothetical protein